jgi:hypothetical protein
MRAITAERQSILKQGDARAQISSRYFERCVNTLYYRVVKWNNYITRARANDF